MTSTQKESCPRCELPLEEDGLTRPALSRLDNQTYVCSDCGTMEALFGGDIIPFDVPLVSSEADEIREQHHRQVRR